MKQKTTKFIPGTIRIKSDNLKPVIRTEKSWKRIKFDTTNILKIVNLYKSHDNFEILKDTNNPIFLKGQLTPDKIVRGQRINILPNQKELTKAFSLFSPNLTIHNQTTNTHWDVIYQNPNGQFAYIYTKEKEQKSKNNKYKKVEEFERILPKLQKNLGLALQNNEPLALPMITLLATYMRVGNEMYYKRDGHKGLTTLKKSDVKIRNPTVTFSFLAKDGIPQKITKNFLPVYIIKLQKKLNKLQKNNFIFTNKTGHPLKDTEFEEAFLKYSGITFYPHIVRSYYATKTTKEFLKQNPVPTKEQIKELYTTIADTLGHKKFSKKKNEWQTSYTVTVAHYIQPKLVEKINNLLTKN